MTISNEEIIEFLSANEQLLRANNFSKLFEKFYSQDALSNFLLNEVGINFLNYMKQTSKTMFGDKFSGRAVVIPENVKEIVDRTFSFNTSIDKVRIEGVSKIYSNAFYSCDNLQSVEIEGDISKLLSYTFHNCSSLKFVYFPESVTSLASNVFSGVSDDIVIVTPWREEKSNKLRIQSSEISWYKQHLKFRHAPKDAVNDQEGEE